MARDLPRVTEQLDPRPHSSLSKALPMPKLVVGVCTPTSRTPTAPPPHPHLCSQQPQQSPAWASDTYFWAALAIQGLVSERQGLKIKRQIVHFGCNYRLKRPSGEKERERRNKGKRISELSVHHRQKSSGGRVHGYISGPLGPLAPQPFL